MMKTSTLKTVAHSHVTSQRKKFVLTSISIGVAAFFLAAVFLLTQTLTASFRAASEPLYSRADYVVNAPGSGLMLSAQQGSADQSATLTQQQVDALKNSSEVDIVGTRSLTYLGFTTDKTSSSESMRAEALPDSPDSFTYDFEGAPPTNKNQVAIPSTMADKLGLSLGDSISVEGPAGQAADTENQAFTVSAVYSVDTTLSPDSMTFYFEPQVLDSLIPAAQNSSAELSNYEEVSVKLKDAAAGFPEDLKDKLSSGSADTQPVIVSSSEQVDLYVKQLSMGLDVLTYVLLTFAGIALVVATFVIANTFRVLTTLRVSELAMLRTLGAQRRQLTTMLLREALALGFFSSLVGVVLAFILAALAQLFVPRGIVIGFSPIAALVGIGVGTLVTVASSLVPAVKAMKVSPLSALSTAQRAESEPAVSRPTMTAGALLLVAGAGLYVFAVSTNQPFLVLIATFVLAIGALLLFPLLLWLLLKVLQRIARGSTVTLALNQAVNSMQRTASTGVIVFLSATLISGVLMGHSTGVASNAKMSETAYPVALNSPVFEEESEKGQHLEWSQIQQKEEELEGIDHVSSASLAAPAGVITEGFPEDQGQGPEVFAVDPEKISQTIAGLDQELAENTVLLPVAFDSSLDGKTVVISAGQHRIEATARVSEVGFYAPLISKNTAQSLLESADTQTTGYSAMVNTEPGLTSVEAQTVLEEVASATGADESKIFGGINDRLRNEQVMKIIVGVMLGLLSLATIIALIGVANTLSLSAFQRRRENAMLRSIGLSAKKLARLVALESLLIAAVSVICGIAAGIGLAMLGVQVLAVDGIDIVYAVNPFALLVVAVFGTGLAYLASLLPAKKASRVSPVTALAIS